MAKGYQALAPPMTTLRISKYLLRGTNGKAVYSAPQHRVQPVQPPASLLLRVCLCVLMALLGTLVALLIESGYTVSNPAVVGALAVFAAVAERGRVQLNDRLQTSITMLPMLLAAVLFGPLAAMIVAAAS